MHNNEKNRQIKSNLHKISGLLPIFFWILLIFGFSDPCVGILTLITALLHEFGHIFFLYIRFGELRLPRGSFFGLRLRGGCGLSYSEEAMLYAAGPMANLLGGLVGLLLTPALGGYALLFTVLNLATAVANMLPIKGHDGYGMIRALLTRREISSLPLEAASLLCSATLCLIALYTVDRLGEGYFIFAILLLSVLGSMKSGLSRIKNENF